LCGAKSLYKKQKPREVFEYYLAIEQKILYILAVIDHLLKHYFFHKGKIVKTEERKIIDVLRPNDGC